VFEDEHTVAFLDIRPLFPGHCLLVPRGHYYTLVDIPDPLISPLFVNSKLIARSLLDALGAEGTFVAMNNRVRQDVPHLHVHIVPRRNKDGLKGFFWPRTPYKDNEEREEVASRIRESVARMRSERA